jgi:hypothetical protein
MTAVDGALFAKTGFLTACVPLSAPDGALTEVVESAEVAVIGSARVSRDGRGSLDLLFAPLVSSGLTVLVETLRCTPETEPFAAA